MRSLCVWAGLRSAPGRLCAGRRSACAAARMPAFWRARVCTCLRACAHTNAPSRPQTVQQLWESVEATGKFPSKNIMKHSLDFLRSKGRIEAKPQDPKNHKVNFVYTLGAKPEITPMEEAVSSAG